MECVVYTINEENIILNELKSDFHMAIDKYYGKRDSKGNRYYIIVSGKPVPFKKKEKELNDISLRKPSVQDIS